MCMLITFVYSIKNSKIQNVYIPKFHFFFKKYYFFFFHKIIYNRGLFLFQSESFQVYQDVKRFLYFQNWIEKSHTEFPMILTLSVGGIFSVVSFSSLSHLFIHLSVTFLHNEHSIWVTARLVICFNLSFKKRFVSMAERSWQTKVLFILNFYTAN